MIQYSMFVILKLFLMISDKVERVLHGLDHSNTREVTFVGNDVPKQTYKNV